MLPRVSGLRERKKQATRDALVRAAMRLFDEQGYAATSVAQVAEAAEVSPATFFVYFPTKEDVVFADQGRRVEQVSEILGNRGAEETVASVLRRAFAFLLETGLIGDGDEETQAARGRVVAASPELRQAAVGRLFACEQRWADALQETDSELDPLIVHSTLGAALGAAIAVASTAIVQSEPLLDQVTKALDLALTDGRSATTNSSATRTPRRRPTSTPS